MVFLLWGAAAQQKGRLVTSTQHKVIRTAHPAAHANAHQPFAKSRPFSRTNQALIEAGLDPIGWGLPFE